MYSTLYMVWAICLSLASSGLSLPGLNFVESFAEVQDIEEFTSQPGVNIIYFYQKGMLSRHNLGVLCGVYITTWSKYN